MATKLKKMQLTSVDLVRAGANQEADFRLYKSASAQEDIEQPSEREQNIFKRFLNWLRENPTESNSELSDTIEKDYSTFDTLTDNRDKEEKLWKYSSSLTDSIRSIMADATLDSAQKLNLMKKSLGQFNKAMGPLLESLCETKEEVSKNDTYDTIVEVVKKKETLSIS